MKTIALIFGTRPEAIKMAPVERLLRLRPEINCRVCVTAQHREMLDQVIEAFGISVDADLGAMRPDQTLPDLSVRLIETIDSWLSDVQPDLVLVQGDTTTAFCAALVAFYRRIPVGHVEAGLRTHNLEAPWPEEANRCLIARLASWHFAPTERAKHNLCREGVPESAVVVTGNTVVDALQFALRCVATAPPEVPGLRRTVFEDKRPLVLVTGHRRESFGPGLERVCRALSMLAARLPDTHFVYPVHPNPNVSDPVGRILDVKGHANIHLITPPSYLPFVRLMTRATIILTDSGGIQEEAPTLGKPVLVTREATERTEAVEAGTAILVGTDVARIVAEVERLLFDSSARAAMTSHGNPFGDGRAAQRIVDVCVQ